MKQSTASFHLDIIMDKKDLIQDFMDWSGGLTPTECSEDEVKIYIETSAPADMDEEEVRQLLLNDQD